MKNIILKRRKELGMTQQQLADKLYVSDKVISKWETGKSIPDTSILLELSKVLQVSVEELLNDNINGEEKDIKSNCDSLIKLRYSNLLIITKSLLIADLILFFCSFAFFEEYNNELISIIFFILSIFTFIFIVTYYFISRNKIISKYVRYEKLDNKNTNNFLLSIAIHIYLCSLIFIWFYGLETHEMLIIFSIVSVIELILWVIIFLIKKKIKS